MEKSKSNGIFTILVLFNFFAGLFNVLSGDFVLGLLFLILTTTTIIVDLVSDITKDLKR